jgi:hypothetical protein
VTDGTFVLEDPRPRRTVLLLLFVRWLLATAPVTVVVVTTAPTRALRAGPSVDLRFVGEAQRRTLALVLALAAALAAVTLPTTFPSDE